LIRFVDADLNPAIIDPNDFGFLCRRTTVRPYIGFIKYFVKIEAACPPFVWRGLYAYLLHNKIRHLVFCQDDNPYRKDYFAPTGLIPLLIPAINIASLRDYKADIGVGIAGGFIDAGEIYTKFEAPCFSS